MRVDSALYAGATVPPYYDSLIAKLIVHDRSRAACLSRLRRALGEYVIAGLPTSLPLLQAIIKDPAFVERRLPHRLARRVPARLARRQLSGASSLALRRARSLCQKPWPR